MLTYWVSPQYDVPSLRSILVFSMESPGFYQLPHGSRATCVCHYNWPPEWVARVVWLECLKAMLCLKKDKQKVIQASKKSLQPRFLAKHTPPICGGASPSHWCTAKAHPCGLWGLSVLLRYWEIRWASRSFRAIGANQGEGKRWQCASGCAANPASSSCSRGAPLLQHWASPVLISLDRLSWQLPCL